MIAIEPEDLTPETIKRLSADLHEFLKSDLYKHYQGHFSRLYDETVDLVIDEPLKGPESLHTREAWIGEARSAKVNHRWFDDLHTALNDALRDLD